MSKDTVSVIIPVYNTRDYIEKCVRSVMDQSYTRLEIVIIDDGSNDGSGEVLEMLASEDNRIRLFHQENQGVSKARNFGISVSSGTYFTFVDGDDYISRNYIRRFVKCAERTNAQMILSGLDYVDEEGRVQSRIVPGEYIRFEKEEWPMRISCAACHFYERDFWIRSGLWFHSGSRGEDMPVALFYSAMCSRISTIPASGYYYVQHASSAMHHFRGLKDYQLPYDGLTEVFQMVKKTGLSNSRNFYELFVLRIFSTCLFDLARGASRGKRQELADYIHQSLKQYFPEYQHNPLLYFRGWRKTDFPVIQKAAVLALVFLDRTGLLGLL